MKTLILAGEGDHERLQTITILGLSLAGFALRLRYLTTTHPFFDEYTTVLAARQILQYGWPVLPSGLFYEHGLLSTYVIAPFTALFINTPVAQWQPAHWGLMLSRWPSALLGTITIPLIYAIGCQINSQLSIVNSQSQGEAMHWSTIKSPIPNLQSPISLLAAGLFALSPEGMVWGGRARMYTLATLLVLLTVYWAYQGAIHPAPARYRWWAILTLLATLLTQFGALMLVPPLVIGMVVVGWLSYRETGKRGSEEARRRRGEEVEKQSNRTPTMHQCIASPWDASRIWFLRPPILAEALALAAVVGLAVWVKRLGQPLGAVALGSVESGTLPTELLDTVTYQTAFHFTWPDTVDFFAQQFGPSHLFWLALVTAIATVIGSVVWLASKWRIPYQTERRLLASSHHPVISFFNLFLWLIFGLIILQMVTLLDPFRRNPRYIVMYLPLFYLIAANAILSLTFKVQRSTLNIQRFISPTLIALVFLFVFTMLGFDDLRVALVTPEPAYEEAFDFIQENWQPNDALLTMNTPAAGLYLGRADGFTVQDGQDDDQFLLDQKTAPVDRWLGAPWLGTAADFNAALNAHQRVWFVIDTIRQPVYFRGDWQAVVNSQMERIWANDNALVYRTRPDRVPLPTQPNTLVNATLDDSIELIGCTLQTFEANSRILAVTLFWRPLHPLTADYTVFLHLRNNNGATVVQHDSLSLNGAYPTSRWQPGETVIDPFTLLLPADLPAGQYTLWAGLYQLETLERLPVAHDTSGENAIRLGEINYQ